MNYLQHVTKAGERWDQLAKRYYGDPMDYERIIAANPDIAIDTTLPGGVVLVIPVVEVEDVIASEELPPWKR